MTLLAFGLNHSTAPLQVRERVTIGPELLPGALGELRGNAGVDEAAILSTCNRTEVYCSLERADPQHAIAWFTDYNGMRHADLQPYLYSYPDATAVKHMLRVASGLDSMVLGEPQVLGQLKSAYHAAVQAGSVGHLLGRLFQHSFRVAKQIRSNTRIGDHPVSIAFAAVRLATQIFGDLSQRTVLLIGAGDTVELAAKHLAEQGMHRMVVANRSLERAQRIATRFSGYAIQLEDMQLHLDEADIVISSTSSPEPLLGYDTVAAALKKRRGRPMLMVDIAVPRDIDPSVAGLDNIYLYTVDDLHGVIEENLRTRKEAAVQAEEIIDTQVARFMQWFESRDSITAIRALRNRADALQRDVIREAAARLNHGGDPATVLNDAVRKLTNRLIHSPSTELRNVESATRHELVRAARRLFNLPVEDTDPDSQT